MATVDLTGAPAAAEARVALAAGDELTLRLDETPSTGHRWVVEHAPDGVELVGDAWTAAAAAAPDARVGEQGVRELRFAATESVDGELVLRLRRPWLDASADDPTTTIVMRRQADPPPGRGDAHLRPA